MFWSLPIVILILMVIVIWLEQIEVNDIKKQEKEYLEKKWK